MTRRIWRAALVCAVLALGTLSLSAEQVRQDNLEDDLNPNGKGWGERQAHSPASKARPKPGNGITTRRPGHARTTNITTSGTATGRATRPPDPPRPRRRASAVRRTSTSTRPTTNSSGTHVSNAVALRRLDHRQLLARHGADRRGDSGVVVDARSPPAACPTTPTASTSCSPRRT